jgi:zinc protease
MEAHPHSRWAASALALLALAAAPPAPAGTGLPELPFEKYQLDNGLTVILSEDHTAPIVGIDVLYHVGSKDEKPGRTGFAHLFEHLMFQGSVHLPKGAADQLIQAAGGSANGGTRPDSTEYWEQTPSNALEQMIYIEAERMGFVLPTLDQANLDNQREVVKNERRQNYEMRPYGLAFKAILENLWNPEFPYHWLPIGSHEDLTAASLEDVKAFFRQHYGPENASLAIAGDFDPAQAKRWVERWFGGIPRGPAKPTARVEPKQLDAEKRIGMEDEVQLPRLYLAWQAPPVLHPDDAPLVLLGMALSSGKSARLVKRMVMDEQIAQSVSAGQQGQMLAGMFVVVATPKPGKGLDQLEKEIDEEIVRVQKAPLSADELTRAKNKVESMAVFALEPVGGFGGRAAMLNEYQMIAGDPGYLPKDLARYRDATAEQVQGAAARWLRRDGRVVLRVTPKAKAPLPSGPQAGKGGKP